MRENYVEVPLLQQRDRNEGAGTCHKSIRDRVWKEKTYDIVRRTMQEISRSLGKEMSLGGGGLENLKSKCISKWNNGGALEVSMKEDSDTVLAFDVKRCDFADLYRELGFGDIGALISCDRDAAFLEGFDPELELVREKTIMEGDDLCDFCYRRKG